MGKMLSRANSGIEAIRKRDIFDFGTGTSFCSWHKHSGLKFENEAASIVGGSRMPLHMQTAHAVGIRGRLRGRCPIHGEWTGAGCGPMQGGGRLIRVSCAAYADFF